MDCQTKYGMVKWESENDDISYTIYGQDFLNETKTQDDIVSQNSKEQQNKTTFSSNELMDISMPKDRGLIAKATKWIKQRTNQKEVQKEVQNKETNRRRENTIENNRGR